MAGENKPEPRIVCAAIRAADGDILIGIRHYSADMHAAIAARSDGEKFKQRGGPDQGFVDQFGEYYTREQAWEVAAKADQFWRSVSARTGTLFSENLY